MTAKIHLLRTTPAHCAKLGEATAGQLTAAEPHRSVWVSANAGTGKTRVLVDRIARLLLAGTQPEKILCLTFTKTAAAEMAARISRRLGCWVVMNDAELSEQLQQITQRPADEDTLKRARELFTHVLETPGGLKIRTIHSFCESLIARFPLEASVAPHFTVIDERTTAALMTDARDRVLAHTLDDETQPIAMAMRHLAELAGEEDFAKLMRELLGRRARLRAVLGHWGDGLDDAVFGWVGLSENKTDRAAYLAAQCDDTAFNHPWIEHAIQALEHGTKTSQEMAGALKSWLALDANERGKIFESEYAPLFVTQKGEPKKKLTTKGADDADANASGVLLTEQDRVLAVLEKLKAFDTALATRSLLTVGRAIWRAFENLKRARAALDYDDLIEKALVLLDGEGASGWVHYKLDGGIDHILVDESQDTSPDQWRVVQGLAEDFFTGFGQHDETLRTVFAVGDEKQSIYSFQGADPYEFGRMQKVFAAKVEAAGETFSALQLTTSFRSTRAVLAIVDRVFKSPEAFDGLSFMDDEVLHSSHRRGEAGLVELWPAEEPEPANAQDPWDAPLDRLATKSPETRLAEKIAATIRGWLDEAEILESKNRPIRADDILILVRKRGSFADEMVRQLKRNRIEVAGSDRMVLTDQLAVQDLMALGRFVLLPEDDLNTATVLKGPLLGLDDDHLMALAPKRKASLWAQLKIHKDDNADFARAHEWLAARLGEADFQPPYEFFASVLARGGRKALVARLGADAHDPLNEFLSLALDFERDHAPSLEGFLHWVTSSATQIKRDMEISGGKVRVMTVHGAKGLEANVVFLPDTCAKPGHQNDDKVQWSIDPEGKSPPEVLWSPVKEMRGHQTTALLEQNRLERGREYRRLLYVAMTRARDRLYVAGYTGKNGVAEGSWYELMAAAIKERGKEISGDVWRYELKQEAEVSAEALAGTNATLALPTWAETLPHPDPKPLRPLLPSAPLVEAPAGEGPLAGGNEQRFRRGLAVHKLLELLPGLDESEREAAAKRWLAGPGLGLDDVQQDEIGRETLAVLNHPDFAPLFSPTAIAEAPVTGIVGKAGHEQVVSGRMDRMVVLDDEVWVVDYKTNRPPPDKPENVAPAYLAQMALYRRLLQGIYPAKRVRCWLLWTDGPRIMELEPALTEPFDPDKATA